MIPLSNFIIKYSLEGHQFAVFGVCLTSDARFVVSVSNKFLIWDLSTSDLTRAVNPGIEGVFQVVVYTCLNILRVFKMIITHNFS